MPADLSRRRAVRALSCLLGAALISTMAPSYAPAQYRACRSPGEEYHRPTRCERLYDASSPFNRVIPRDAPVAWNSAEIMRRIRGDLSAHDRPGNLIANTRGNAGEPTYYSRPTDPLVTLRCRAFGAVCPLDKVQIRIPAGAVPEGGTEAPAVDDRHMTVVDRAGGWEYDLWQVSATAPLPPPDGVLEFSWGGRTRIDGDGLAFPDVPPGHATAAHFGSLAGRVRAEHLQRGLIDHALFIVINCDNGGFVYPARASGRACHDLGLSDVDAPPMGSLLHLDMSASEIDRLGIPSWKKTILRAMGEYGMYFGDTGTEGYFTIETESGNQYQSLGFSDPWWALATGNDWERFDPTPALPASGDEDRVGKLYDNRRDTAEGIDRDINWERDVWSRLRVLDPCVARGDCTAEPAPAASPEPSATAGASIPDPGAAPALRPFDAASGWADPAHGGLRVRPAAGAPAEARSSTGAGLSF